MIKYCVSKKYICKSNGCNIIMITFYIQYFCIQSKLKYYHYYNLHNIIIEVNLLGGIFSLSFLFMSLLLFLSIKLFVLIKANGIIYNFEKKTFYNCTHIYK